MKSKKLQIQLSLSAFVLAALAAPVFGQQITWGGTDSVEWSDTGNWVGGVVPGSSANNTVQFLDTTDVNFQPTINGAQPSGGFRITELLFSQASWTLNGSDPLTLDVGAASVGTYITSNGNGTNRINAPIVLGGGTGGIAAFINIGTGNTLIIGGGMAFSGTSREVRLFSNSSATLRLESTLDVSTSRRFLAGEGTTIELANNSGLAINAQRIRHATTASTYRWFANDQVNASALWHVQGNGLMDLNNFNQTAAKLEFALGEGSNRGGTVQTGTGILTLTEATPMQVSDNYVSTSLVSGNVVLLPGIGSNSTFNVGTPGTGGPAIGLTIDANVSGTGNLRKAGDGTLALNNAANTYTGTTTVNSGTLLVNGGHSGGGAYTVGAGSTLGGSGIINTTTVTTAAGAKLLPGAAGAVGNLRFTLATAASAMNISASSNGTGAYLFDLAAPNASDRITLTLGTLNIGNMTNADFVFNELSGFTTGMYVLFDAPSAITGSVTSLANSITFSGGWSGTLSLDSINNNVVLNVIPEPSTFAMLLGVTGLLTLVRRR